MESEQLHEEFDTGLKKIKHEIKNRLVLQGLFGTITSDDDPKMLSMTGKYGR